MALASWVIPVIWVCCVIVLFGSIFACVYIRKKRQQQQMMGNSTQGVAISYSNGPQPHPQQQQMQNHQPDPYIYGANTNTNNNYYSNTTSYGQPPTNTYGMPPQQQQQPYNPAGGMPNNPNTMSTNPFTQPPGYYPAVGGAAPPPGPGQQFSYHPAQPSPL